MTPTFYCNCFPEHEPTYTQINGLQKNLMCGSVRLASDSRKDLASRNFYFDDVGQNISHLNEWMGDLTGLYWVWKNTQDEFVGTNQYRRYWMDEELSKIHYNDKTIYISAYHYFQQSIYKQYEAWHSDTGLKIFKYMADKKVIDMPFADQLNSAVLLSSCNMFFTHRSLFDRLCRIIFDISLEMFNGIKYALPIMFHDDQVKVIYQKRTVAYVMERVLSLVYQNSNYYFGPDIKIEQVGYFVKNKSG